MGNATARPSGGPPQDPLIYFQTDLPKFIVKSKIGNGKFLKSYSMTSNGFPLVVKVYSKPFEEDLTLSIQQLSYIWRKLPPAEFPNLLPYQFWVRSTSRVKVPTSPVYLVRQRLHANLHDRMLTRPFLHEFEKIWLIYQLFQCVEMIHNTQICHGDIKPENILVTTWNWLVLTDFASFKPSFLPIDDPNPFQYYFDPLNRGRCYIAPERFQSQPQSASNKEDSRRSSPSSSSFSLSSLAPPMDVFSLGCTIAEFYLDGEKILDLPGMLRVASAPALALEKLDCEDSPARAALSRLTHPLLQQVVLDMTQRDPRKRLSAAQYKALLQGREENEKTDSSTERERGVPFFPSYFESLFFPLFQRIQKSGMTPDDILCIINQSFGSLVEGVTGKTDSMAAAFFAQALSPTPMMTTTLTMPDSSSASRSREGSKEDRGSQFRSSALARASNAQIAGNKGKKGVNFDEDDSQEEDEEGPEGGREGEKEDFANMDLDLVMQRCQEMIREAERERDEDNDLSPASISQEPLPTDPSATDPNPATPSDTSPSQINSRLFALTSELSALTGSPRQTFDGLIVPLQVVISNYRHLKFPQSRLVALALIVRLGLLTSDSIILQRLVPIVLHAMEDIQPAVKATALRALRSLLSTVRSFTPVEGDIFPNYIFPVLSRISKDSEIVVRIAFAESIAVFAEIAKRFLDTNHIMAQLAAISASSSEEPSNSSNHLVIVDFPYDSKLKTLHEFIGKWIRELILDTSQTDHRKGSGLCSHGSLVKRVLFVDILRLCVFFGHDMTCDLLLTQLLTFLNDQDWELRSAFCSQIPAVCLFIGNPQVTSDCILPCIENALVDVEERVVCRAVQCLNSLIRLSLLTRLVLSDLIQKVCPLTLHPSHGIRSASTQLIASIASFMGPIDAEVILLPKLQPFLRFSLIDIPLTESNISYSLRLALSRSVFRKAFYDRQVAAKIGDRSPRASTSPIPSPKIDEKSSVVSSDPAMNETSTSLSSSSETESWLDKFTSLTGPENPSEVKEKLLLMTDYLDRAAKEIIQKTVQWRNNIESGRSSVIQGHAVLRRGQQGAKESMMSSHLDTLLELGNTSLPEQSLHNLFVPHQRFGSFPSISEELRRFQMEKLETLDYLSTRYLFGLSTSALRTQDAELGGTQGGEDSQGGGTGNVAPISQAGTFASAKIKGVIDAIDSRILRRRLRALNVPPLPPDFGTLVQPDDRKFNYYMEALNPSDFPDPIRRTPWKPRENVMVNSFLEHTHAVNRLAVSPDQTFIVSASSDKTAKVWPVRNLDKVALPRSAATYTKHRAPILDVTAIENSHSVATCSQDGLIHVWRVDLASSGSSGDSELTSRSGNLPEDSSSFSSMDTGPSNRGAGTVLGGGSSISGTTHIRSVDPEEGPVLGVQHFNNDIASVLLYSTQKGFVHGWDLRSSKESFLYSIRPELGAPSSMALDPDRNWVCVGTDKGYISLWDIRYNVMSKLWRHSSASPIHRMFCNKALPLSSASSSVPTFQTPSGSFSGRDREGLVSEGGFLFVAAGPSSETAVFGIPEAGECLKCFRSLPLASRFQPIAPLPSLSEVRLPRHPLGPIVSAFEDTGHSVLYDPTPQQKSLERSQASHSSVFSIPSHRASPLQPVTSFLPPRGPSVRAMIGRISPSHSFLVTAGTDRQIRMWDFLSPQRSFTVSGLQIAQPKPIYDAPDGFQGRLTLCYDTEMPSNETIFQANIPLREGRGPLHPPSHFKDTITDLKHLDIPFRLMLASSKDGEIKIWR